MNYRNARYIDATRIDCELEHPVYGWIPYTLDPADTDMTVDNSELLAELAGNVAPYVPPTQAEIDAAALVALAVRRETAAMTKREFCRKLLALGILPPDEALSAARGGWPATFAAYTAGMDALASADAQIEWAGATSVDYAHPMLHGLALVQAGGDTAAATALLDAIFDIA